MGRAVYFTRLDPVHASGGGVRRLRQVLELLAPQEPELLCAHDESLGPVAVREAAAAELAAWNASGRPARRDRLQLWEEPRRPAVLYLGRVAAIWRERLTALGPLDLAILDDPIYFEPLLVALRQARVPVLAVCHNLESLVRSGGAPDTALLAHETALLGECSLVVTIAEEENHLLTLFGVNAVCYPYYPVAPVLARLLAVRAARSGARDGEIVSLVNGDNRASERTLRDTLRLWQRVVHGRRLVLSGFGSESIAATTGATHSPLVDYRGVLSDDQLEALLRTAGAALCYQLQGCGALTKIRELLIAGLPVLANPHAARSYHGVPGVLEFRDDQELVGILARLRDGPCDVPCPLPPDPEPLRRAIAAVRARESLSRPDVEQTHPTP